MAEMDTPAAVIIKKAPELKKQKRHRQGLT